MHYSHPINADSFAQNDLDTAELIAKTGPAEPFATTDATSASLWRQAVEVELADNASEKRCHVITQHTPAADDDAPCDERRVRRSPKDETLRGGRSSTSWS